MLVWNIFNSLIHHANHPALLRWQRGGVPPWPVYAMLAVRR